MTVIAVPEAPPIVCPKWCVVTQAEHVAELPGAGGLAIHWSRDVKADGRALAALQLLTFPDGTPLNGDRPTVWLNDAICDGDGLALDAAEQVAKAIVTLAREAR